MGSSMTSWLGLKKPLVNVYIAIENHHLKRKIIYKWIIFHSKLLVYWRVTWFNHQTITLFNHQTLSLNLPWFPGDDASCGTDCRADDPTSESTLLAGWLGKRFFKSSRIFGTSSKRKMKTEEAPRPQRKQHAEQWDGGTTSSIETQRHGRSGRWSNDGSWLTFIMSTPALIMELPVRCHRQQRTV